MSWYERGKGVVVVVMAFLYIYVQARRESTWALKWYPMAGVHDGNDRYFAGWYVTVMTMAGVVMSVTADMT